MEEEVTGNGNGFHGSPSVGSIKTLLACNRANQALTEGWVVISNDKEYTPGAADVGCKLRIEVRAVAQADGELLAGPISLCTDAVLQAPGPPPKRVRMKIMLLSSVVNSI